MASSPRGGLRPGACPQDILEWKTARSFLYWRLRRLLLEDQVKQEILRASGELSHVHIQSMLRRWFVETEGAVKVRLGWGPGGATASLLGGGGSLSEAASPPTPGLPVGQQPDGGAVAGTALAGGGQPALHCPREHQVLEARLRPQGHQRVSGPLPTCPPAHPLEFLASAGARILLQPPDSRVAAWSRGPWAQDCIPFWSI